MASPNIKFFTKDEGSFTITSSDTVAALIGFAKKGPIGVPTFCNTKQVFQETFGLTPKEFPYSHLAAYKYFENGSNLWFVRIATDSALESSGRVLTNDGTGLSAKLISSNIVGTTAGDTNFASATYGVMITVDIGGVEYRDTIYTEIDSVSTVVNVVQKLNLALSSSATLNGKCSFYRCDASGVLSTTEYHVGLQTTATGMDDSISMADPTTGNSLLYNGTIGLNYTSLTAYGNYSAPSKASVTGTISINTPLDLSTNYNVNILLDSDTAATTINLASQNQATLTGNVTVASNVNTTGKTNLDITIDGTLFTVNITSGTAVSSKTILSKINAAIYGKGVASIIGGYLQIYTLTKGTTGSVAITVNATNDASTLFVSAPTTVNGGTATTLDNMVAAINVGLNTARGTTGVVYASKTTTSNYLVVSSLKTGSEAKVYINTTDGTTAAAPANNAFSTTFSGVVTFLASSGSNGTVNGMFKFVAKEKGTAYDYNAGKGLSAYFSTRTNPLYIGPGDTTNVKYFRDFTVTYNGSDVETFQDISFKPDDDNWLMKKVNATVENGGSDYISIEFYQADTDGTLDEDTMWPTSPTTGLYLVPDGTTTLTGGNDGIATTGLEALYINGLSTLDNNELYSPHMIATPGISSISVINALISFIDSPFKQDILYCVDAPFGLTPQEIADWHNGKSKITGAPSAAINSEFLSLWYSWLKIYDTDNQEYVWCPPSVILMGKLAKLDNDYGPWTIPAGDKRGIVIADDIEYSPSQAERDLMYSITGNLNVNPIVNWPGQGLTLWGQKTLYRAESPRNRLNVERLLIYVKKLVRTNIRKYLFEPNVATTWADVTKEMNNIFEPIKQVGGLTAYQVVFSEETTTASMQNQHKMAGKIRLQVPSSIEAIEVNFSTVGQDVAFS